MFRRKTRGLVLVLGVTTAFVIYGSCKPETTNPPEDSSPGDADADTDADGDSDGDGDGDGDSDPDADLTLRDVDWDGICDAVAFNISLVTPDMLIVLDRSNSMQELGHWDPVRQSIYSVTEALDHMIWFGLMVFPNIEEPEVCEGSANQCVAARAPIVECAQGRSGDIQSALTDMTPCGGTPIAATLNAARTYLDTLSTTTGHPSYVVLATDGAPNCNPGLDGTTCTCTAPVGCDPNMLNCLDDARTYGVIDALRGLGVGVFVIGITASEWRAVLDEMASRGGTGVAFMADESAGIQSAFEEITGAVSSCEFELGAPDPSADPDLVNFYFDDVAVPMDADGNCDTGWVWVDLAHTRVRFCGGHCDQLQGHTVSEVRATFGCPTLI